MPSSVQAIYILIVLLPGFFTVTLVELLTGTREKAPLRLTAQALALSFVVYVVYSILAESGFLSGLQIAVKPATSGESLTMFPAVDMWSIVALSGISVVISVVLVACDKQRLDEDTQKDRTDSTIPRRSAMGWSVPTTSPLGSGQTR